MSLQESEEGKASLPANDSSLSSAFFASTIAVLILLFTEAWMQGGIFLSRGPRRQILVCGVEENATLHDL